MLIFSQSKNLIINLNRISKIYIEPQQKYCDEAKNGFLICFHGDTLRGFLAEYKTELAARVVLNILIHYAETNATFAMPTNDEVEAYMREERITTENFLPYSTFYYKK